MLAKILIATVMCATTVVALDTTTVPTDGSTDATSTCTDAITGCDKYVNTLCKNTVYADVMYTQCRSTCGMCDAAPCEDTQKNCPSWNTNGYCASSFYTTAVKKQNCAKTCNLCSATVSACEDVNKNCASWNTNGFCKSASYSADTKKANCAKTCNLCGTTAPAATTKAPAAGANCVDVNKNCAQWNTNGFCTSTAYSDATKKVNCAKTCARC